MKCFIAFASFNFAIRYFNFSQLIILCFWSKTSLIIVLFFHVFWNVFILILIYLSSDFIILKQVFLIETDLFLFCNQLIKRKKAKWYQGMLLTNQREQKFWVKDISDIHIFLREIFDLFPKKSPKPYFNAFQVKGGINFNHPSQTTSLQQK